jgi:branched-chain amino acid transport system ATP-binding protein
MPLLEVESLSKDFGGVRALHKVSLSLEEGELLGVMGPNGSGKSTLFNLIAGALRPDGGRIRLRGQDIARLAPHRICSLGVARTFQLVRTFAGLSALENVLVGCRYGRDRTTAAGAVAAAERLLALVGMGNRARIPRPSSPSSTGSDWSWRGRWRPPRGSSCSTSSWLASTRPRRQRPWRSSGSFWPRG